MNDKLKSFLLSWKGIVLLLVLCGAVSACGGGSKGKKTTDKEGKEVTINVNDPSAYMDAVKANDYTLAHEVLDELYSRYLYAYNSESYNLEKWSKKYWSAADYIYKAEMQWLLPQNDPEANRRLLYTLDSMTPIGKEPISDTTYGYTDCKNEYEPYADFVDHYNKLCYEIVRVAAHNDNLDMANQVVKMFKEDYVEERIESGYYKFIGNWTMKERAKKLIEDHAN